jgi:hypothetical protein
MKKHNRIELEIGSEIYTYQGSTHYRPAAFVSIETTNDQLLEQIISALTHVEALEV